MPITVDLNCDMGESFGAYHAGNDAEAMGFVTSANVACGFHASDPSVMEKTVALAKEHGVMVGAHPGYPDLQGFGRRFLDMGREEIISCIIYQVGALKGFTDLFDTPLQHVKLHGALYNYMVNEEDLFLKVIEAVRKAFGDVIFLTLGTRRSSELKRRYEKEGVRIALEAFPDRMYTDGGELLPRKYRGAVLKDEELIARRAVKMVRERGVESASGCWVDMNIDTLCIHGDNRESIEAAKKIRQYAAQEGIGIQPLTSFV